MMLHRQNQSWGYDERNEDTAAHQLSIRTNAIPFVEVLQTPLPPLPSITPPIMSTETCMETTN